MSTFRTDIRRGELYWVDWSPGRGSEQTGRRPALVVGADAANTNERYPLTVVAALSRTQRAILTHVALQPNDENGLTAPSSVKCEQLMTVSKERLVDRIGQLDDTVMAEVELALKRALQLH